MSYQTGDPLGMRLRIAPGATLSGSPSAYPWVDVSGDVAWNLPIQFEYGGPDEASETNSQLTWTFKDNSGRYDVENPESDLYGLWDVGCPVELAINLGDGSGWIVKTIQYVGEIGDDYTDAPNLVYRGIEAGGMFRRLGAFNNRTLASPVTRNARAVSAVRYYRLEDGSDARSAVSDTANNAVPMTQLNGNLPAFASRIGIPGSLPGPNFTPGTTIGAAFGTYAPVGTSIYWQFLLNVKTLTVSNNYADMTMVGSSVAKWRVFQDVNACPRVRALDGFGNTIYTSGAFFVVPGMVAEGDNRSDIHPWWWYWIRLTQSGADLTVTLVASAQWIDGNGIGQLIAFTLASDTLVGTQMGKPTGWVLAPGGGVEDAVIMHMTLNDSGIVSPLNNGTAAQIGWPQNAGARILGVSNEANLPSNVTVSPTVQLGPQQPGTVLSLLRDAALADHGILDDSLGVVGYRGLYDLYNLAPSITLDGANRELFDPYAPVRDDQKRKNQVIVGRPGGSSAQADDLVDQAKAGVFTASPTLNLGSDADLASHAQFGVVIGTQPGKRYPQVTLDLLRAPQLARPWASMRLGDRFRVVNPPRGGSRVERQLQLRGATETWVNRRQWVAVCNTVIADPWNVAVLEDPILGRAEADEGSVTVPAETNATATSLSVATAAGHPLPITTALLPSDFPFTLLWDGEEILVTAVVGAASPQTFTVVRSMNGVRKSHRPNSILRLKTPMRPAL